MRTLLLINARVDVSLEEKVAEGEAPRRDFFELRDELGADLIDLTDLDSQFWTRSARRLFGAGIAQALLAWTRADRYDVVFADREPTGFAFAALRRLKRQSPRLVMIGHLLSTPRKQVLARILRVASHIDTVIVHSTIQREVAETMMGFGPDQVVLVPYQCDDHYWAPQDRDPEPLIASAGLEYRDYRTFVEAVDGIGIDVVIAAASRWSHHQQLADVTLPLGVHVASYDYAGLRDLYARSLFIVVPLLDGDNQAGITTILEAMSMGKAVVVSHTRGQSDVVRDRRRQSRADPERITQPDWGRILGAPETVAGRHTGIYVMPGDVSELRRAVLYLLEHPEEAATMGRNGRRFVHETMSLNLFVERVAAIIRGGSDGERRPRGRVPEHRHDSATLEEPRQA